MTELYETGADRLPHHAGSENPDVHTHSPSRGMRTNFGRRQGRHRAQVACRAEVTRDLFPLAHFAFELLSPGSREVIKLGAAIASRTFPRTMPANLIPRDDGARGRERPLSR